MPHDPDADSTDKTTYRDWSHSLDALQQIGEEIQAIWREQNPHSPRSYPTVQWLVDNGYSHLRWILREKHEMGTPEFFVLFTSASNSEGYEWQIQDPATVSRIEHFLDDRVECRDWSEETRRTNRARINTVVRRFKTQYGTDAVVSLANDPSVQPNVYESFKQVIKDLRKEFVSNESVYHYLRATHRFFEWLDRSGRIAYDPMADLEDEFTWEWGGDPTPLEDKQVRLLWQAAETDEERMLVIGYCVWGLRTKELPAVHIDQIKHGDQGLYIEFDDSVRKNGQGEVSIIFGVETLLSLLEDRTQQSDWNGYLFPGDNGRSFLSAKQARKRFKDLCDRAGVTINGNTATPKHGRSFYYNVLTDAESDLLELAAQLAEEQGGTDATSVRDYYLSDERQRRHRRIFFRERLKEILPADAYREDAAAVDYNSSLDDFS